MDRKGGFPMVKEQGERLEVVRDRAREVCQGLTKKAIRRHKQILSRQDKVSIVAKSLSSTCGRWIKRTTVIRKLLRKPKE